MRIRRGRAAIVVAAIAAVTLLTSALAPAGASAGDTAGKGRCHAGAPGVGDDYYPLYGNGGYDVKHYLLRVSYDPATDRLAGVATISARATENLCRFNLDLQGLTVRSVVVNGRRAGWSRSQDHELTITPRHPLKKGRRFTTVVRYDGVPRTQQLIIAPGVTLEAGFIHTDDGAVIAGEPEVAANWFPVNDHPIDKAAYTFVVTVPPAWRWWPTAGSLPTAPTATAPPGCGTPPSRWRPTWPRPPWASSTCAGTGRRTGC